MPEPVFISLKERPPRDRQPEMIGDGVAAFSNDVTKIFIFETPPGDGKSFIAPKIAEHFGWQALYLTGLKHLQKQLKDQYGIDIVVVMGRRNYLMPLYPGLTCADCPSAMKPQGNTIDFSVDENGDPVEDDLLSRLTEGCCPAGGSCEYVRDREAGLKAPLTTTNFDYFLLNRRYQPFYLDEDEKKVLLPWPVIIIDEADTLEQKLISLQEFKITGSLFPFGVEDPNAFKRARQTLDRLITEASMWRPSKHDRHYSDEEIAAIRDKKVKSRRGMAKRLADIEDGLQSTPKCWVKIVDAQTKQETVFRPTKVSEEFARKALWSRAKRFIVMSGTVLNSEQLLRDSGCPEDIIAVSVYKEYDSIYPQENRVVELLPKVPVTKSNWDEAMVFIKADVRKSVEGAQALGLNSVVICNSYNLQREIEDFLRYKVPNVFVHASTAESKDSTVAAFKRGSSGVLLGVDMHRGVDFEGDACRNLIIPKLKRFNPTDAWQVARTAHDEDWPILESARWVIQATGRSVRSKTDWSRIMILDPYLTQLYAQLIRAGLDFPDWWKDSVVGLEGPKYTKKVIGWGDL